MFSPLLAVFAIFERKLLQTFILFFSFQIILTSSNYNMLINSYIFTYQNLPPRNFKPIFNSNIITVPLNKPQQTDHRLWYFHRRIPISLVPKERKKKKKIPRINDIHSLLSIYHPLNETRLIAHGRCVLARLNQSG